VFLGFRLSRKGPTERSPYGLDRAEDLAGIGIAVVIWDQKVGKRGRCSLTLRVRLPALASASTTRARPTLASLGR
jgi:hypothetical protein